MIVSSSLSSQAFGAHAEPALLNDDENEKLGFLLMMLARALNVKLWMLCVCLLFGALACGNEADELGVGAQCSSNDDCAEDGQTCLTAFKGGYCGVESCTDDAGCPEGARCVTHTDNKNYCFRVCADKAECNANRDVDVEANCSSNVTFADGTNSGKACVPPSQ